MFCNISISSGIIGYQSLRAKQSNLLDSAEIASSLTHLAMTKNHGFRRLPEFIEMLLKNIPDISYNKIKGGNI